MATTVHLTRDERADAKRAAAIRRRLGRKTSWTGLLRDEGLTGIRRILLDAGLTPKSGDRNDRPH